MLKTKNPLHWTWKGMIDRCYSPNLKPYKDYGGRGITVCDRWRESFHAFVEDMGERPDGMTLDRRDNDLGYSPENCRWATHKEQQRNRRLTIRLEIEGQSYLLIELAEFAGLKADTIKARYDAGLSYQEIVSSEHRPLDTRGLALGGKANGARQKSKTHCPQGHEYIPENLTADGLKKGWRRCKICHAARQNVRNKAIAAAKLAAA